MREGGGKEEGRRRKERESDRKNPRLTVYISRLNKINLAPDQWRFRCKEL